MLVALNCSGSIRAHNFDGAGGNQGTDDSNRQWQFNDGVISLPDDDAAHIALVNQFLHSVGQIGTLHMYLFSVFWPLIGIRIRLGHACSLFLSEISRDDDME